MTTYETICQRRSIRFFAQKPVGDDDLRTMVDGARRTSTAGNKQGLRYVVVRTRETVEKVFGFTAWAALVTPRRTPTWGVNAPLAFILVTGPRGGGNLSHADAGAAIQSMQLIARERGLGCCWLGAINRNGIAQVVGLEEGRELLYAVAVGHPAEEPVSEDCPDPSKLAYYLDDEDRLHVPKLSLDQVASWQ